MSRPAGIKTPYFFMVNGSTEANTQLLAEARESQEHPTIRNVQQKGNNRLLTLFFDTPEEAIKASAIWTRKGAEIKSYKTNGQKSSTDK